MRSILVPTRVLLALAALLVVACDGGGDAPDGGGLGDGGPDLDDAAPPDAASPPDAPPAGVTVAIAFEHLANGSPIVLGTDTPYTNAVGNQFGVSRVSYFVSDVTLTTTDGATFTVPGGHYVDHDTPATRLLEIPVEAGVGITSISFHFGLPPELNVTGAFTSPPESLMEWPVMMGGGYHYMKFEGRYINAASEPFNMMVHSGALHGTDYSFPVELPLHHPMTVGASGAELTVAMNLEEWFTNPNDWDLNDYFNATMHGIMGNADAQASLQENGAGVFTLVSP